MIKRLLVAIIVTITLPQFGHADFFRDAVNVGHQNCQHVFDGLLQTRRTTPLRFLVDVLRWNTKWQDRSVFVGPKELEVVYDAFVHDPLFRMYLNHQGVSGHVVAQGNLKRVYGDYLKEKRDDPQWTERHYWRNFYFLSHRRRNLKQYWVDVKTDPWNLFLVARDPKSLTWRNAALKIPGELLFNPLSLLTGAHNRLPFLHSMLGFTVFSVAANYFLALKNVEAQQHRFSTMFSSWELVDLKLLFTSARFSLNETVDAINARTRLIDDFYKAIEDHKLAPGDQSNRRIQWMLSENYLWNSFRLLQDDGFFKSTDDYENLLAHYADYYLALYRVGRIYKKGRIAGGTRLSETERVERKLAAQAKQQAQFYKKLVKIFGQRGYSALELFIMGGLNYGILSERLREVYDLSKSGDRVIEDKLLLLMMTENPFYHLDKLQSLARMRKSSDLANEVLLNSDRMLSLLRFEIIDEAQALEISMALVGIYKSRTPESYKEKMKTFVQWLNAHTAVPIVLYRYLLNIHWQSIDLPQQISFHDSSMLPPVHLETYDDLALLAATRFEFYPLTQDPAFMQSLPIYETMLGMIETFNQLRKSYHEANIPEGKDALYALQHNSIFGTYKQRFEEQWQQVFDQLQKQPVIFSTKEQQQLQQVVHHWHQDKDALLSKADQGLIFAAVKPYFDARVEIDRFAAATVTSVVAQQVYFFRLNEKNGFPANDWQQNFAEKSRVLSLLYEGLVDTKR